MKPRRVVVNDRMQRGYVYLLTEPPGGNFDPQFRPQLTPAELLKIGVFGGKYMTDCAREFPAEWFRGAKLCAERHDPRLNFFGVNASQPLAEWRNIRRHVAQLEKRCERRDLACRPRQRQSLLHWAYDSRLI